MRPSRVPTPPIETTPAETSPVETVHLAVQRWGTGRARALLVHGICSSAATWWQIGEGLAAAGFTAVAPDLRGHGSSPVASRYRAGDFAADLAALGTGWDVVVGHSLGGLIVAAAARDRAFARRVVLIDPVLEIADDELAAVTAANVAEAVDPPSAARLQAGNPGWHPEHARLKARAAEAASPVAVERTMHDNAPWHHAGLAEAIASETIVLGADPAVFTMCPPAVGEGLAAANPRIEYRLVAGTGHSVHRDRPDVVLAAAGRA